MPVRRTDTLSIDYDDPLYSFKPDECIKCKPDDLHLFVIKKTKSCPKAKKRNKINDLLKKLRFCA